MTTQNPVVRGAAGFCAVRGRSEDMMIRGSHHVPVPEKATYDADLPHRFERQLPDGLCRVCGQPEDHQLHRVPSLREQAADHEVQMLPRELGS